MPLSTDPIDGILRPDEKILWRGQPRADVIFSPADVVLIPFTCMWASFAIMWEGLATGLIAPNGQHAAQRPAPIFFMLWGVPFVCVGLYMAVGRFFHMRWLKQRTWYAVTNKRIIVVNQGITGQSIKEQDISTMATLERRVRSSGVGTLDFDSPNPLTRLYSPWPVQKLTKMAFVDIADANQVYELLQNGRGK